MNDLGAGEIAQQRGVCTALAENLSAILSIHINQFKTACNSDFKRSDAYTHTHNIHAV